MVADAEPDVVGGAHPFGERAYRSWKDRFPDYKIEEIPETEEERAQALAALEQKRKDLQAARRAGTLGGGVQAGSTGVPSSVGSSSWIDTPGLLEDFKPTQEQRLAEERSRICIWCGALQPSLDALADHEEECQP